MAHNKIVSKLQNYGIQGKTKKWINKWVKFRNQKSCSGLIQYQSLSGCHREQFSALSCSSFTSMTSTKTSIQKLDFLQMTVYYRAYREINSKLDCSEFQQDLQKLVDWSHTWKMSFNINKCHTLHAHRKKQPIIHTCTMDNTPVTPVTHHLYLGIELQSDLRWTTHIQNTTNKVQKTLNMLKRNLKQASTTVKSQAYKTIVRPGQLEYMHQSSEIHTQQKISTTLTKYKTMQKDGSTLL